MLKVRLYIDKPKRELSRIKMSLSLDGRSVLFLPLTVDPKEWDILKQRMKVRRGAVENERINNRIEAYVLKVRNIYDKMMLEEQQPNHRDVQEELLFFIKGKRTKGQEFWDYVDDFLMAKRALRGPKQFGTTDVMNSYEQAIRVLQAYEKKTHTIKFKSFDAFMYAGLIAFMRDEKKYSVNQAGKIIKFIRAILNSAVDAEITTERRYKKSFKILTNDPDVIYLTEDEIDRFRTVEIEDEYLSGQRDLFVVGCYTALRYSDFGSLKPHSFKNGYIHKVQQKTGDTVVIPIHRKLLPILEKHDYDLPFVAGNMIMNKLIKKIGRLAGIDEEIHYREITMSGPVEHVAKKYELITTHTARRSLATNLYLSGFPVPSIMKITGHKTYKDFMKYLRLTPSDEAEKLKKHWEG